MTENELPLMKCGHRANGTYKGYPICILCNELRLK